tara:strand:- start:113 stop:634 length:522 start_codon:yes stop_codon:yes gene_type:complete
MSVFEDLLKKHNRPQLVVAVVLAVYIISGVDVPHDVATYVNTSVAHIFIIVVAFALFVKTNLVLGVLILIAAYEVIRRSYSTRKQPHYDNSYLLNPTENFCDYKSAYAPVDTPPPKPANKTDEMVKMQPTHDQLEIEIIQLATPISSKKQDSSPDPVKPIQPCLHDAALINQQ